MEKRKKIDKREGKEGIFLSAPAAAGGAEVPAALKGHSRGGRKGWGYVRVERA